jgi:hypothetical protein
MSILTTFRLADPFGNHLIEIANYSSFTYVLNCAPGNIGVLELELPRSFNTSLLRRDGRIGAWRAISGRAPYLDNGAIYLIETVRYRSTSTFVRAYHATGLLGRRIVAYASGSTYASKSATAADDLIKTVWAENAGASIVSGDRDGVETQADISAYVTTPTEATLELRTYTTQRGVDRRASTASPIILREQAGVLENATLEIDYRDEKTFTVAGGQGEGTQRLIATALDTGRMGASPFGRIEKFADMSNVADATALQDDADADLRYGRPVITFTGDLIETSALTRGIQFDLGDQVTAEDPQTRQQYDVRLDMVSESMDSNGRKTTIALRSVT